MRPQETLTIIVVQKRGLRCESQLAKPALLPLMREEYDGYADRAPAVTPPSTALPCRCRARDR